MQENNADPDQDTKFDPNQEVSQEVGLIPIVSKVYWHWYKLSMFI